MLGRMLSLPLPSRLRRNKREVSVANGDLPQTPDPRLAMRWAIVGLAAVAIPVVLLTAQSQMGPGVRYSDVAALCITLAAFAVAALLVPWQRLEEHWLLLLVGVPVVFVAALNSLTGAGQSPYLVMYAPILAIAGWYLSGRQTGLVIALVVGTELWRAFALDRSGSIDHLAIALPFVTLISATASLSSRWLRNTLTQIRRDQIRLADTLDAVRALGINPQLGVLAQLERAAAKLFDAKATAIRIDAERSSDAQLASALVEERVATVPVSGTQTLHALLRIEAREPLTAQDVRLAAVMANAAGRTLDWQRLMQQTDGLMHQTDAGREPDSLTGLLNRRSLEIDLATELTRSAARGPDLALLYVEIDDFRQLDERYGHAAGDAVLVALARMLKTAVNPGDAAYRIGGDSFAILLRRRGRARAQAVADQVSRHAFPSAERAGRATLPPFGVSVGLARPASDGSARDVLAAADQAIYRARQVKAGAIATASGPVSAGAHI